MLTTNHKYNPANVWNYVCLMWFVKIHILHDLNTLFKFPFPNLHYTDLNHIESKNAATSKFYRI